jgi:hypothetical protein
MARQKDMTCATNEYGRTWVWQPDRPSNALLVTIPGAAANGSDDVFCSGHAFLPDGSLLVVGGQDYPQHCAHNTPFGHKQTHRLDTSVHPPVWEEGPDMGRERWYPTALTLHTGDIFVPGHSLGANPGVTLSPLGMPYFYPEFIWETHERFDAATMTFQPVVQNLRDPEFCLPDLINIGGYPRLHLLSTGKLIRTDAARPLFLDVKNMPGCLDGVPRWDVSVIPDAFGELGERHGGNSIHIVYWDEDDEFAPFKDVIYAIGGTDGDDDAGAGEAGIGCIFGSSNVEKMVQPEVDKLWTVVAPLNQGRFNQNTVILPTGELITLGGTSSNVEPYDPCEQPCGPCPPSPEPGFTFALDPERYRPPELFLPGDGAGNWVTLISSPVLLPRSYHAVAGLLPDGRVFVAGGRDPGHVWYTVDIYSPQYMFCQRPMITAWPDPTPSVGAMTIKYFNVEPTFDINVTLSDSQNTVERIVLLRNGSITHAQDMSQRYVELAHALPVGNPPFLSIQVQAPLDGFIAPPGYYLLYVVERKSDPGQPKIAPSEGKWVRLE